MTIDIYLIIGAAALVVFGLILSHLRIVPQSEAWVMERAGVYSKTWLTGIHFIFPFIEKVAGRYDKVSLNQRPRGKVDLRERVVDYKPQDVITKDNVRMSIDSVVFYQVTDPKLFVYGHQDPELAIEHLTATTLRNVVGELELDATLTSRETINTKMRVILDEAADAWGLRVTRVELQNINIDDEELKEAMEKQMIAERRRREMIITAEGIRKSEILKAEGLKQAEILKAEGKAEAILRVAEAESEKEILERKAQAEGIRLVNESQASKEYLTIKSLEAFAEAADGEATKIIIPSEIQGLASLATSASELFKS